MDISQNVPKKRGRKPKLVKNDEPKPPPKKRGRKPKGGKIITNTNINNLNTTTITNIILHLKCSLNDLNEQELISQQDYNPNIEIVESFDIDNDTNTFNNLYELNDNENILEEFKETNSEINETKHHFSLSNNEISNKNSSPPKENTNYRITLSEKINKLQHDLKLNNINSNSACFWCTEHFDTPVIHIPKNKCNNTNKYNVYGCFCSPECACAYLIDEKINDSEKFERYHLLNFLYGNIYNYTKNIRPAPNPYYTLSKFMGNLTIDEYRNLFMYEKLLLVIDKPLTRNLPQLFEDNDSYKIVKKNSKINSFNINNKSSQNKNEILHNNFGGN